MPLGGYVEKWLIVIGGVFGTGIVVYIVQRWIQGLEKSFRDGLLLLSQKLDLSIQLVRETIHPLQKLAEKTAFELDTEKEKRIMCVLNNKDIYALKTEHQALEKEVNKIRTMIK
jgi:hypothetical protein